ncbi:MAG: DUF2207 domain-containing protein, partial [Candidatus Velamenicoccus archaeovorus]
MRGRAVIGGGALAAAAVLVVWMASSGAPSARAQAVERILRYDVTIHVDRDDSVVVRETIVYDFGSEPRHGIFRDVPTTLRYDDTFDRVYPLTVMSVTGSPGTPVGYTTDGVEGGKTRVKIGDPDRTITGRHTYVLTYRIEHALNGFPDHDELYWNAIGPEWQVTIERATVRVDAPGAIERIACFSGPTGSTLPCGAARLHGGVARFGQDQLFPYQSLTVVVGLPKGVVAPPHPLLEERWSLRRAFRVDPPIVAGSAALLVAVLVGLGALLWRTGRDRRFIGSEVDVVMGAPKGTPDRAVPLFEGGAAPVEFAPPEDLRPGQMGTLLDEAANPLDVTATIVDLAVRGYLVIEEIPKEHWWGKPDWTLRRKAPADEALLAYERSLLTGLFEGGDEVRLSSLKARFVDRLRKVQDALYRDAAAEGWFVGRPDTVRARWRALGIGTLVVAGGLEFAAVRWTHLGWVPVPVVLGALLLTIGAGRMPRRTPKGTGLVRRVKGFRTVIATAETHMARWAEQENVFTRYLPYAIV